MNKSAEDLEETQKLVKENKVSIDDLPTQKVNLSVVNDTSRKNEIEENLNIHNLPTQKN